jgi:hypothetical protein
VPRVRFITRASTRFFSASLRRCARVSKPESMRSVCDWLLTLTTALKEPIASALASAIIGSSTPSTSREIRFTSSRSDIGVTFIASRANMHRPYMDAFAIECLKHSGSANAEVVWLP